MNIFKVCPLNVVRRTVLQLVAQDRTKRALFLRIPCKVISCRTLVLSPWLNKDTLPSATEKLDLDEWKRIMQLPLQEETSERTLENEEDRQVAATNELVEMGRLLGRAVPENITEEELKILTECPTKSSKWKYLRFLFKKEAVKKAEKEKRERKKAEKELKLNVEENADGELEKGGDKQKNTLFLYYWSNTENTVYSWRAAQSMMFGQPLVFDMDYENCMSRRELQNAVKQLQESEGANRRAVDPFHLHYCNLKTDGPYHKELIKRYGEAWDKLFVTVTEKNYAEIFPRDQLVYLTADSRNVMKTFEHDKIYIIGGLVDKSIQTGLSLGRAKRLKLTTARLPLDKHLLWTEGAKNLTLDQMIRILLTLKHTGDWEEALQFVPHRKHAGFVKTLCSQSESDTWKKTKLHDSVASQKYACKSFVRNSSRQQMQRRWWEDES